MAFAIEGSMSVVMLALVALVTLVVMNAATMTITDVNTET